MKTYKAIIYTALNEKILYLPAVNYYFGLRPDCAMTDCEYQWTWKELDCFLKKESPEEYSVFSRTSIEKRIGNLTHYSESEIRNELELGQFTLCFHPSRKCNLNCKYCFGHSDYLDNQELSFDTIKKAIDYMLYEYAPYGCKYIFDFSGSGEPLLKFDLIRHVTEYCKEKRQEIGKAIEIMFCSNLTLMTREMADYFENESMILLGTSLDGGQETNDNNRIYKNGKGTFQDVKKSLELFQNKKFGIASTITPLNQKVDEIFDELYQLPNVDCISMRYIREYSGSAYDFDHFDIDELLLHYEKLCENVLFQLKQGNFDYLIKLINGADVFGILISQNLRKGGSAPFRCEMGKNRIICGPDGKFYSCSVMMGSKDFCIGSLAEGVRPDLVKKYWERPKDKIPACKACDFHQACGGECYANSYLQYGNMYTTNSKSCQLNIRLNKLSYAFLEHLKRTQPENYQKFVEYSFRISNYTTTNTALWALVKWSTFLGKPLSYEELIKDINPVESTTEGNLVLQKMRQRIPSAESYQMDLSVTAEDFPIPGISVHKRDKKAGGIEYLLVYGIKNKHVIFEGMGTRGIQEMPLKQYLTSISDIILL